MESVTSLFTFGYSQQCPYTGKELGDHYALVTAPDRSSARTFMNTAFKRNWAFEYDGPGDTRIADYVPRMTLHMTVNLVPEQPMPPGFDYVREAADPTGLGYSRADDGETTHFGALVNEGLVDESEPRELLAIAPSADGGVAFAVAPAGEVTDPVARAKVVELTEAVAAYPPEGFVPAMLPSPGPIPDCCPRCNHWPWDGRHPGAQGCAATGGSLHPCGCTYAESEVEQ